jgi:hypothetical protein
MGELAIASPAYTPLQLATYTRVTLDPRRLLLIDRPASSDRTADADGQLCNDKDDVNGLLKVVFLLPPESN